MQACRPRPVGGVVPGEREAPSFRCVAAPGSEPLCHCTSAAEPGCVSVFLTLFNRICCTTQGSLPPLFYRGAVDTRQGSRLQVVEAHSASQGSGASGEAGGARAWAAHQALPRWPASGAHAPDPRLGTGMSSGQTQAPGGAHWAFPRPRACVCRMPAA